MSMKSEYLELNLTDARAYLTIEALQYKDLSEPDEDKLEQLLEDLKSPRRVEVIGPMKPLIKKYLNKEDLDNIDTHIHRFNKHKNKPVERPPEKEYKIERRPEYKRNYNKLRFYLFINPLYPLLLKKFKGHSKRDYIWTLKCLRYNEDLGLSNRILAHFFRLVRRSGILESEIKAALSELIYKDFKEQRERIGDSYPVEPDLYPRIRRR